MGTYVYADPVEWVTKKRKKMLPTDAPAWEYALFRGLTEHDYWCPDRDDYYCAEEYVGAFARRSDPAISHAFGSLSRLMSCGTQFDEEAQETLRRLNPSGYTDSDLLCSYLSSPSHVRETRQDFMVLAFKVVEQAFEEVLLEKLSKDERHAQSFHTVEQLWWYLEQWFAIIEKAARGGMGVLVEMRQEPRPS